MADFTRHFFDHDGLHLSYLDTGGDEPPLLALHGHLNEARFVMQGAVPSQIPYRTIALDQRGHGQSDHAHSYRINDYVDDAVALLDHLKIESATVLGHSLGGVVAYTLAARAPDRVEKLVIVDIGAVVDDDLGVVLTWLHRAPTRRALVEAFGFMGAKQEYVMRKYADGWGVPWNPAEMVASQEEINGDHWQTWLATTMPALLIHGSDSHTLNTQQAEDMAQRRPATTLIHLAGGHAIYVDAPSAYVQAVTTFLAERSEGKRI